MLPALAGFFTGILSAWGIGGGTLLLLVMSLFLGVDQITAQGINLLYFLPTAAMALVQHRKNGLLDAPVLGGAIPWGLPAGGGGVPAVGGAGGVFDYSGGCGGTKKALWGVSFGCRALHCFQQDSQGRLAAGKP